MLYSDIMKLTEFKTGSKIKVINIFAGKHAISRLSHMNIHIDSKLEVIAKQPVGGPITVKIGSSEQTIGRGLASKIDCELNG